MQKKFEVVLLGSDMNVYGMARSLHEQYGIISHSIGKMELDYIKYSKILKHNIIPDLEDDSTFANYLLEFHKKLDTDKVILVACGDTYVDKIITNKKDLSEKYIVPYIDQDLSLRLQNKKSFYKICDQYGLKYPKTQIVNAENYQNFTLELSYPIVLKPANTVMYWLTTIKERKKAYLVHDNKQLDHILYNIYSSDYNDDFILQEYLDGDDSSIAVVNCYSTSDGEVVMQTFGNVLLEDHAPNGIGSHMAIISSTEPELLKQIKLFLEDINYIGFSNFDLKYDFRDNTYKFFEINLRQGRSSYYVTNAGCNLGKYLVEEYIFNNTLTYETGKPNKLWSVIPKSIIMKYVKNREMKSKFLKIYNESKYCNSLIYAKDLSFKRLLMQTKNFHLQKLRYLKHFSDKEL
ncbi:MAG: ATP-grasp domain-containing protein [Bacilli bacterium]